MNEYIKMLENNEHIKFVVYEDSYYKYVAVEDGYEPKIIIVHQFKKSDGSIEEIYVADACNSLKEFVEIQSK